MDKILVTNQKIKYDKDDRKISIALMTPFVILTIQYFILVYFGIMGTINATTVKTISKGLVGISFLYAFPAVIKRNKIKVMLVYFIAVFIFLLHYAIFPENRIYIIELFFPVIFMSLPAFVYSLSIYNLSIFKGIMKRTSYVVFVVGGVLGVLVFTGKALIGAYSMSLSYYMLLPSIMFLDELLEFFSLKLLMLATISVIIILALGSRGAILCIIVFLLLKILSPSTRRKNIKILLVACLSGIGVLGFIFKNRILEYSYNLLLKFGIRSRTLRLFLQQGLYLSKRDEIYKEVIDEIYQNPILGIGLKGDTRILGGGYVHNLFIEVLGNFGLIIGITISVGILILIVRSLMLKDRLKYDLTIIWVSLGFVHLMVSGTYLTDIKFWILMGLLISFTKSREKNTIY